MCDPNQEQVLCRLEDIPDGNSRGFLRQDGHDRVFAVRIGADAYVYLNACPHEWVSMNFRKDYFMNGDNSEIVCYAHGAHFTIESGLCTSGPCINKALVKVPHRISAGAVIIPLTLPEIPVGRNSKRANDE